jgi:hypothetical protein
VHDQKNPAKQIKRRRLFFAQVLWQDRLAVEIRERETKRRKGRRENEKKS